MTWFKIDDRSHHNPKVLAAGNEAWGAFCRAGAWASENLTDGNIPVAAAHAIAKKKVWKKLLECELVVESESGYKIPKFLEYNPCSSEVLEKKAELSKKRAEQGRLGGLQSGETRRSKRSKTEANEEANPKQTVKQKTKQTGSPDPDPDPGFGSTNQIQERERAPASAHESPGAAVGPIGTPDHPDPSAATAPSRPDRESGATPGRPDADPTRKSQPGAKPPTDDPRGPVDLDQPVPDWAMARYGTLQMSMGLRLDLPAQWSRYLSHISDRRQAGEARPIGEGSWSKWLQDAPRFNRDRAPGVAPSQRQVSPGPRLKPEERPTKPTSGSLLDYIKEPAVEPTGSDS